MIRIMARKWLKMFRIKFPKTFSPKWFFEENGFDTIRWYFSGWRMFTSWQGSTDRPNWSQIVKTPGPVRDFQLYLGLNSVRFLKIFWSVLVLNFSIFRPRSVSVRGSLLLAIRYNEKIIAVSSEDGSVYFLNNKMVPIANVKLSDDDVTSICFGKEENLFASSTKFVYEIDLKTYKLTGRYVHGFLEGFKFRWLKIKGMDAAFLNFITLFSNHLL